MKYVYMLKAGEQHYKVGISSNVMSRLKSIQTGNPNKVLVVTTNLVKDAESLEKALHKWLGEYKADGGSEWFVLTDNQALGLAARLNSATSVDLSDFITLQDLRNEQRKLNRKLDDIVDRLDLPIHEPKSMFRAIQKDLDDTEIFQEAVGIVKKEGKASTSLLQRRLRIGYARAARILEQLENSEIVSPPDGARPRTVLTQ